MFYLLFFFPVRSQNIVLDAAQSLAPDSPVTAALVSARRLLQASAPRRAGCCEVTVIVGATAAWPAEWAKLAVAPACPTGLSDDDDDDDANDEDDASEAHGAVLVGPRGTASWRRACAGVSAAEEQLLAREQRQHAALQQLLKQRKMGLGEHTFRPLLANLGETSTARPAATAADSASASSGSSSGALRGLRVPGTVLTQALAVARAVAVPPPSLAAAAAAAGPAGSAPSRRLVFAPRVGCVTLELEAGDGETRAFTVSPLCAAVMSCFAVNDNDGDEDAAAAAAGPAPLTAAAVARAVCVGPAAALRALRYWVTQGVLVPCNGGFVTADAFPPLDNAADDDSGDAAAGADAALAAEARKLAALGAGAAGRAGARVDGSASAAASATAMSDDASGTPATAAAAAAAAAAEVVPTAEALALARGFASSTRALTAAQLSERARGIVHGGLSVAVAAAALEALERQGLLLRTDAGFVRK